MKEFVFHLLAERNLTRLYINARVNRVKRLFRWAAVRELSECTANPDLSTIRSAETDAGMRVMEADPSRITNGAS